MPDKEESETRVIDLREAGAHRLPRFHVKDLLGAGTEAVLVHAGSEYRLRITSAGRLILTK